MIDPLGSKAWAAFATKLLDVVKSGVGALSYRWLVVGDAKASVEAAKILALGQREVDTIKALPAPSSHTAPRHEDVEDAIIVDVEWEEPAPLAERTHDRLEHQEQKRQLNTEKIVRAAAEAFDGDEVDATPVDDDWTARFFTSAQDVSNEEMQQLWGKLLGGEVKRPGTFSLRTLEVLRDLSVEEARLFSRFAALSCDGRVFADVANEQFGVNMDQILKLQEAGLVSAVQVSSVHVSDEKNVFITRIRFRDVGLIVTKDTGHTNYPYAIWRLTGPGEELARVVRAQDDLKFIASVAALIKRYGFNVDVRKITWQSRDDEVFTNEVVDLPPID